jgi:hypothetical protein
MMKSDFVPLAPRQRLSPVDPASAISTTLLAVGANAVGGFVAQWAWQRYQGAKQRSRRAKEATLKDIYSLRIETIEEHILTVRRETRVSLKIKR